jgi:hypothetical protein
MPIGTHTPLPADTPRSGAAAAARDVRLESQPGPHQRRILPTSLRWLPAHLSPPLLTTACDAGFSVSVTIQLPFLTRCSTLRPYEMIKSGAQALKESSRVGRREPSLMVWWADVEGGHQGRTYLWLRIPRPGVPCNDSGVSRDVAGKRSYRRFGRARRRIAQLHRGVSWTPTATARSANDSPQVTPPRRHPLSARPPAAP